MNEIGEMNIKQAAIQDVCKAVRWGRMDIQTMYYDSGKDSVLIRIRDGSLWENVSVSVAGDTVIEMRCDIMDAVRKHR
jgi:hypothetical protein